MEMVAHHGIATKLDREQPCELSQPIENPLFTVAIVLSPVRVDAEEEGPSNTSNDAVINAYLVIDDDLAAGARRHQRETGNSGGRSRLGVCS
jgi:hypothetical protein